MGFPWAEAIGGAANLGSSALSAYFGWKHQKEVMRWLLLILRLPCF